MRKYTPEKTNPEKQPPTPNPVNTSNNSNVRNQKPPPMKPIAGFGSPAIRMTPPPLASYHRQTSQINVVQGAPTPQSTTGGGGGELATSSNVPVSANTSVQPSPPGISSLVAGKYRIVRRIGSGSFGVVFHGYNVFNNREVAIKVEPESSISSQLTYESKVYNVLSDGKHVPFSKLYTSHYNQKALVIDLLGPSLEEFYVFCNREFSLKTVCMLADQLITVIEYVHQNSIIHCDIKPDNFLMGMDHNSNRVFMIDFGLSKQFRSGPQHNHIKYSNNRSLTGTARYVSINTHVGIAQSRRDDLESIGYVLVYFCVQCLPWQGIECRGKKQKYDRICEKKLSTPVSVLCKDLPMEFMLYINYCRHLRFDETPDYSFVRSLFRSLLKALDEKYDLCFEWLTPKYLDPMKEYLMNLSSSFLATMRSRGAEEGVYLNASLTNPQLWSSKNEQFFIDTRETYLMSFFGRYPYMKPSKFQFSVKNYYRCYFMVPPGLMTPVSNILRGLQSNANPTPSSYNSRSGFTAATNYRSSFARSNFSKK